MARSRGDLLSGTSSSSKAFSVSEKTSSSSSSNSSVSFRNFIHFENCLYRLNFQKYIRANPTAAKKSVPTMIKPPIMTLNMICSLASLARSLSNPVPGVPGDSGALGAGGGGGCRVAPVAMSKSIASRKPSQSTFGEIFTVCCALSSSNSKSVFRANIPPIIEPCCPLSNTPTQNAFGSFGCTNK